ncbi:uncharacterized protein LOC110808730 isoform X2 [Carica papaya]|uniref:uncharacterized protein LOC110808730 isoform X2 n=1 Tax=Carica papaya TaxID=3649 RepID=UPI000B8C8726|nr:uncharacterized protein LOC110808730 isoform X2 [Carica papaya]
MIMGSYLLRSKHFYQNTERDPNDYGDTKTPGSSDRAPNDYGDTKMHSTGHNNTLPEGAPQQQIEWSLTNNSTSTLDNQITHDCELNNNYTPAAGASANCEIESQKQFGKEEQPLEVMIGIDIPNAELSMVNGTPLNMSTEKHRLLFAMKSGQEHPNEDWMKEKSSRGRSQSSDFDHISDQQYWSPLVNSSSSLNVIRPQISLDKYLTPLKQSINQGESLLSIQKTKSKSKIIGTPSLTSSALRNKIEKSKLALSEYNLSRTSSSNVVEETSKDLQHKHVDAPITNLGTQLSSACIPQCKPIQLNTTMVSPSHFMGSGKKVAEHPLETENFAEGRATSNSLLGEVKSDGGKHKNERSSYEKFPTSLVKRLNQRSLSSVNNSELEQQDQYDQFLGFSPMKKPKSFEIIPDNNYSTILADKLGSFIRRVQSSSLPTKSNYLENFTQVENLDNGESHLSDLQNVPDSFQSFQAPLRDKDDLKFQLESPGKNLQISTHATSSCEELPAEGTKASSSISPSPYMHQNIKETSLFKSPTKNDNLTWQDPTLSASKKELHNRSPGEDMQLVFGKDASSINPNSNEYVDDEGHEELSMLQSHFSEQDVEDCSRKKRKGEEIISGNAGNSDKIGRASRSPVIHKSTMSDSELLLDHSNGSNQRDERIGGCTALRNWTDISQKFSIETHKLLSPLADKLQIRAIGMLEDSLAHLKKVHQYKTLCSKIMAQNAYDISSNVMLKRQAEIRLLLSDLAYEKANLQLMYLKHERLLKKSQLLSFGIQECELLRFNFKHLSIPTKRDTIVAHRLNPPCSVDSKGKYEVPCEIVTKMKKDFEALDRKIKNAAKSFHTYFKMKGEPSCADTISFLNDYLKKRMGCRFLRQDMQLWEVDDLESGNGHHTVVLNYLGLICQRLTIKSEPPPNVLISNKLIDIIITKNFPNMDVGTAFTFVFNSKSMKKYMCCKSLAHETQTTSLLLRNLLDVVEEVQLAKIEIQKLMQASFNSSSAEQLNLQLSFVDLDSSKRVMIILDMTCLNCGIYPSEVCPYELQCPFSSTEDLQPQSLYAKIKTACGSLRGGYPRIINLCRCVSQVLQ